mgnify:CR=1 FL=1
MNGNLLESWRGRVIGLGFHRRETLTAKELNAKQSFMAELSYYNSEVFNKPIIVAMIGLVGSGKTSVAKDLGAAIAATVIEGDKIRVELRKQKAPYEKTRAIAEDVAIEITKRGGNVVIDSDFIDTNKRASLREKVRKAGVRLAFVCTYCDLDVANGRIMEADYTDSREDFFGGASTKWEGSEQSQGVVVKLREMVRRLPLHYRWSSKGGGKWEIKKPPCFVVADIDTTDPVEWRAEVKKCAKKILAQ